MTKLSRSSRNLLSEKLLILQSQIPVEFQRTTRSLFEVVRWKATEYRLFLLYLAPIILKRVLLKDLYNHFMLLHSACRILCSRKFALKYNQQAKTYLTNFVLLSEHYYGKKNQISNIHNLIHLADDCVNMNCSLSDVMAFPFENELGKLKKKLRSGNKPLAQLCRRIHENSSLQNPKAYLPRDVIILKTKSMTGRNLCITKLKYKQALLTTKSPNNTVLLSDGGVIAINKMYVTINKNIDTIRVSDIEIHGTRLKLMKPIFKYPCNSKILNMWEAMIKPEEKVQCILHSVSSKMIALHIDTRIYVIPLLHCL